MAAEEVKETPEVEVSPKKKKGIPMVAIIAAVAVLALGGGVLVGKILGGKGGDKPKPAEVAEPKNEGKEEGKEAGHGEAKPTEPGKETAAPAGDNGKAGLPSTWTNSPSTSTIPSANDMPTCRSVWRWQAKPWWPRSRRTNC